MPEADFGISSTRSISRSLLYGATRSVTYAASSSRSRSSSSGAAPEITIFKAERSRSSTCGAVANASTTGGATWSQVTRWRSRMSSRPSRLKRGMVTIVAPLASLEPTQGWRSASIAGRIGHFAIMGG